MRALNIALAVLVVFAAAMLIGWTQARYVTPQMTAAKASGGADLCAANPFCEGARK